MKAVHEAKGAGSLQSGGLSVHIANSFYHTNSEEDPAQALVGQLLPGGRPALPGL